MFVLGFALAGAGLYALVVGAIWLLVKAFQKSVWWGLGAFFIPLANIVFGIFNWKRAGSPLMMHTVGFTFLIVGGSLIFYDIQGEMLSNLDGTIHLPSETALSDTNGAN